MTRRARPVPSTHAETAQARLAGSAWLYTETAWLLGRDAEDEEVLFEDLPDAQQTRLSQQRAPICGLTLDVPRIMGILNVTPDSFSDGGTLADVAAAVARAQAMAVDVDILDIGGESTRPGAQVVPVAEEINRVVPVIKAIREAGVTTPVSIDTRKAAVAQAALAAGADMVNDVTALRYDPDMAYVVAEADAPVCLMHAQGGPETMQDNPQYDAVTFDVFDALAEQIAVAEAAGIARDRIITDPGIGFGKTLEHNLQLLRDIAILHDLGLPILLGASRKRFIGTIAGVPDAADRLGGSLAVALLGVAQGVQIVRVHDTQATRQAISLHMAVNGAGNYG